MFFRLLGNLIPIILGIIAIKKWKNSKLNFSDILERIGVKPFPSFQIISGFFIGALIFTIIFIVFKCFNLLTIIQFSWTRGDLIITILLFATMAIIEEIIFRGFFINGLKQYIKSTTMILIISASFFSFVHWFNDGSTVLSSVSAFIGGLMYAYAFVKTNKLWFPIGLHFSWNFFQSFIYGFPVSGFNFKGLFELNISGGEL